MDICQEHDGKGIAYTGSTCPACVEVEDIQNSFDDRAIELLGTIQLRNIKIDDLESQIEDLEYQIKQVDERE